MKVVCPNCGEKFNVNRPPGRPRGPSWTRAQYDIPAEFHAKLISEFTLSVKTVNLIGRRIFRVYHDRNVIIKIPVLALGEIHGQQRREIHDAFADKKLREAVAEVEKAICEFCQIEYCLCQAN